MKKCILIFINLISIFGFSQENIKIVEVHQPQTIFLNAAQNVVGNSRQVIRVSLPPKTIKWYYTFSAYRNKEDVAKTSNVFNLMASLSKAIDASGLSGITLKMLGTPPGTNYCDVYLLSSKNDVIYFENKDDLIGKKIHSDREGTRENLVSGVVDIGKPVNNIQYLGFRNRAFFGINISFQVVAIVEEDILINGWTKNEKDVLFLMLKDAFNDKENSKQIDDLSSCVMLKLTSVYSPAQLRAYANYELNKIIKDIGIQCEKELDFKFDESQNITPKKENLIGRWKDENSVFTFFSSGLFSIKRNYEEVKWGNWEEDSGLVKMKFNNESKSFEYRIIELTNDKFVYENLDNSKSQTIYNSVKIGQY